MWMSIRVLWVFCCFIFITSHADMTEHAASAARTPQEITNSDKVEVAKQAIKSAVGEEVGKVINRQIDTAAKQEEAKKETPTNAERVQAEGEVAAEEKSEQLCRACKAAKGAKNCPCAFMEAEDKKDEDAAKPADKKEEHSEHKGEHKEEEAKSVEKKEDHAASAGKKEEPAATHPEHTGEEVKPEEKKPESPK